MKLLIAAGGTGGHIFPALSVALEWKRSHPDDELFWVGTSRNREQELCRRHGIPLEMLAVQGVKRSLSISTLKALVAFGGAVRRMHRLMRREKPDAVLAFGGYVTAPVVLAARLRRVPYFLQEQNTVPGLVNRLFAGGARASFLGFPLANGWRLRGPTVVTGTPVRSVDHAYPPDAYPEGFERGRRTVLVCGGSQGALTMDRTLAPTILGWVRDGLQVVWQTGEAGCEEMKQVAGEQEHLFISGTIPDLYPFYAASRVVIGRSGASTLSETAYFGLPCVLVPLPWSAENHQWMNAGMVEAQGWGIRVKQDERCGEEVDTAVRGLLGDASRYEAMCRRALDHTPGGAAGAVVRSIRQHLEKRS